MVSHPQISLSLWAGTAPKHHPTPPSTKPRFPLFSPITWQWFNFFWPMFSTGFCWRFAGWFTKTPTTTDVCRPGHPAPHLYNISPTRGICDFRNFRLILSESQSHCRLGFTLSHTAIPRKTVCETQGIDSPVIQPDPRKKKTKEHAQVNTLPHYLSMLFLKRTQRVRIFSQIYFFCEKVRSMCFVFPFFCAHFLCCFNKVCHSSEWLKLSSCLQLYFLIKIVRSYLA